MMVAVEQSEFDVLANQRRGDVHRVRVLGDDVGQHAHQDVGGFFAIGARHADALRGALEQPTSAAITRASGTDPVGALDPASDNSSRIQPGRVTAR